MHEQSRADRDSYVLIHRENVIPSTLYNFDVCTSAFCTVQDLEYDYASVMHYGSHAFAIGANPTITKLDGTTGFGQRNGFSDLDIKGINKFYCGEFTLCKIGND